MFTLQTRFQPLFLGGGGGGGVKSVAEVTVKNSEDFGPYYVQEFC
jgi:hypothetical protein